jgi:hypothetical protein
MVFDMSERPVPNNRSLINAFIILHVVAIVFWSQPFQYWPRSLVREITSGYMYFCGVWQEWDMFAPGPRRMRIRMDATVTLRDGTRKTWTFPQMDQMTVWDRLRKERYRKWAHDGVRFDSSSYVWEPTARYIARQFADPDNPPVAVQLHRHWADIPAPTAAGVDVASTPFNHYTFYEMKIAAGTKL